MACIIMVVYAKCLVSILLSLETWLSVVLGAVVNKPLALVVSKEAANVLEVLSQSVDLLQQQHTGHHIRVLTAEG